MALRAKVQDESARVRAIRETEAAPGGGCLHSPARARVPRDQVWGSQPHTPGQIVYFFPSVAWRRFRFYVI